MQEADLLLKSVNELEFLITYHKHIITSSKCKCDTFMDNLRELYRIYVNLKYLTSFLKNGINNLYNENMKLKYSQQQQQQQVVVTSSQSNMQINGNNSERLRSCGISIASVSSHLNGKIQRHRRPETTIDVSTSQNATHGGHHHANEQQELMKSSKSHPNLLNDENTAANPATKVPISNSVNVMQTLPFNYLHNQIITNNNDTLGSRNSGGAPLLVPIATSSIQSSPNTVDVEMKATSAYSFEYKNSQNLAFQNEFNNVQYSQNRIDKSSVSTESSLSLSFQSSSATNGNNTQTSNDETITAVVQTRNRDSINNSKRRSAAKYRSCDSYSVQPPNNRVTQVTNEKEFTRSATNINRIMSIQTKSLQQLNSIQLINDIDNTALLDTILPPPPLFADEQQQHTETTNETQLKKSKFKRSRLKRSENVRSSTDDIITSNDIHILMDDNNRPPYDNYVRNYECIKDDENEIDKKRVSRGRVIDELVQTEIDFFKVMKLLYDVYLSPHSENTIDNNLKQTIFCNLKQIMDISSNLLNDLEENILNKSFDNVIIGKCFLKNAQAIKNIYAHYAQYIEHSNTILEKSDKSSDVKTYLENGLSIIRQQTNAFDLHSLLLKPIQRVLKYPLLLQELIKYTDESHIDYADLQLALTCMQDVAAYINEIKRRRDLIIKYGRKIKEHSTISNRMAKITFHSMRKKSNRFSMRISNAFGLNGSGIVDEEYNRLETNFRCLEKLVKTFSKDALQHLSSFKDLLSSQAVAAESILEYYAETKCVDVQNYVHANAVILNEIYNQNRIFVHEKVIKPLNSVLKLFEIPNKLITKRQDKLLDYECALTNAEKVVKDKNLYKTVEDNLHESKKNYEALNNQLLEELPILIEKCFTIFEKCVFLYLKSLRSINENITTQISSIITQESKFQASNNSNSQSKEQQQELKSFFDNTKFVNDKCVDLLKSCKTTMPTTHNKTTVSMNADTECVQISTNQNGTNQNFLQKTYRNLFSYPVMQKLKMRSGESNGTISQKTQSAPMREQDADIRARLEQQYKKENLYKATGNYTGFGINGELKVRKNEIVGIIKKADPCGNPQNWFVDNGLCKGIMPSSLLQSLNTIDIKNPSDFFTQSSNNKSTDFNDLIAFDDHHKQETTTTNNNRTRRSSVASTDSFDDDTPPVMTQTSAKTFTSHSYVNINDETNTFTKLEYCVALYNFDALDEHTLSVTEGERLKIIKKHDDNNNDEWWLLESEISSRVGYVPANYVQLTNENSQFTTEYSFDSNESNFI